MKKLITALAATGLLTLTFGLVGCGESSTVTEKKEISTPGGTATTTDKKEIKQTGSNPPSPSTTTPAAPK
jgi:hypothetical protein